MKRTTINNLAVLVFFALVMLSPVLFDLAAR
jgi:hypothetical protein